MIIQVVYFRHLVVYKHEWYLSAWPVCKVYFFLFGCCTFYSMFSFVLECYSLRVCVKHMSVCLCVTRRFYGFDFGETTVSKGIHEIRQEVDSKHVFV